MIECGRRDLIKKDSSKESRQRRLEEHLNIAYYASIALMSMSTYHVFSKISRKAKVQERIDVHN
eukprot:scaffold4635_cov195-Skeletonema_marinoi.AAC.3